MKALRLTQVQLADIVGMSQTGVGRYLRGNIPKADHLHALAKALGMTMEELLTGENVDSVLPSPRVMEEAAQGHNPQLRQQVRKAITVLGDLQKMLDDDAAPISYSRPPGVPGTPMIKKPLTSPDPPGTRNRQIMDGQ